MSLSVHARVADAATLATPLLIVLVPSGSELPASLQALDTAIGGAISRAWQNGDFTGKRDESLLVHPGTAATRVLCLGLGDLATAPDGALRRAAMIAGKRARTIGVPSAAILVAEEAAAKTAGERLGQVIAEGVPFGAWHWPDFKRPPETPKPVFASCELLVTSADPAIERGLARGRGVAAGQAFTRELQILPANTCTPAFLAARATELATRHGFGITVLDPDQMRAEGMHAHLAVGQGSVNTPRFIALEYRGAEGAPTVLIGKGVTFDTGGVSIKPAPGMEEMKYDMSGAAAVLGTFEMLGQLKPALHVIGLVPTAENAVSGSAYRPGDIVGSHLGKTIEVLNTDAEGRLLLADALSYARRYEPKAVVDCATLTGAVVIGLGHTATAVLGTDPDLIARLQRAGEQSGERIWELPLWDDYRELIKSDIADMKNTGGRAAGTITAAWFLREFVEGFPWAHLDIAGTAYTEREMATQIKGPTGVLVRLFSEFLLANG